MLPGVRLACCPKGQETVSSSLQQLLSIIHKKAEEYVQEEPGTCG